MNQKRSNKNFLIRRQCGCLRRQSRGTKRGKKKKKPQTEKEFNKVSQNIIQM